MPFPMRVGWVWCLYIHIVLTYLTAVWRLAPELVQAKSQFGFRGQFSRMAETGR